MKAHENTYYAKLEEVSVSSGQNLILDKISMEIKQGEIVGLIGPNGAGKTTLFRTLLGEVPYSGKITFERVCKGCGLVDKKYAPMIGYVPQYLQFDKSTPLTVLELFAVCLKKKPIWLPISKKFREEVRRVLAELNLEYVIDRKIGFLSGGELQRVLLALAIIPTPDILLLDEPISGVDVSGQEMFYAEVQRLREQYGMGIILITHDFEWLDKICDRGIVLNKSIVDVGTPESMRERAKEVIGWR